MSEQHSACTTASKRAKNTRARGKIAEYSDVSSEDELSVSEEEYIPDTSESYTSDSSMSFTASPKGKEKKLQTLPVRSSSAVNRIKKFSIQSSGDLGSSQNHDIAKVPDTSSILDSATSVVIPAVIKKRGGLRMYSKKQQCFFVKVCKFKPGDEKPKPGKTRVQVLCGFAQPPPPGVTHGVWKLLNSMNQDQVALETRNDWCILELGKHLYNKYGSRVKMHEHIRQKMRELGRLLICAREVSPLTSIKELIHPTNFMHTINAVKRAAGYNEETNVF
ncbi:uncharacterized protein LOC113096466 [Carassius auratus]|uniref:Uncharacterized protein LOC113096466 n=1 Tax=Carassius auratus TaxID=7957 RepID=A0A6P6P8X9_CARAU|nr:uncharacterized protein LOC113096466 [Carassius auratus]